MAACSEAADRARRVDAGSVWIGGWDALGADAKSPDYFTALGTGQFTQLFTDDSTWTTVDGGTVARGRREVQDAILDLHAGMSDMQTRQLVIADEAAYIEGSFAGINGQGDRVLYCVAYDLDGSRIA